MKKSFVVYHDQFEPIKDLSNEQIGMLFKQIFKYQFGGEVVFNDPVVEMAFGFFKQTFDRDGDKYFKKCSKKSTPYKRYIEKLKDPRWQKIRLEIFNRDDWKCRECDAMSSSLHVHHSYYDYGLEPWEYPEESLYTLCEDCHGKAKL